MCPLPNGIAAEQFPPPDELLGIAEAADSVMHALSQYWLIDGVPPELNPAQDRWCPSGNDTEDVKAFFLGAMARILVPMDRLAGLVAGLAPDYLDGVETKLPADILPRTEGHPIRGWPFGVHCAVAQVKAFKGKFRADEPMPLETLQQLVRAANTLRNAVTGSENDGDDIPTEPNEKGIVSPTGIKRPSEKALQAWRLRDLQGKKQEEIAVELGTNQGQVSRWLRQVNEYLMAGNVLPPLRVMEKPTSMDPADLDMGARIDTHTPRQRQRRVDDSED